jgi:uncharacterized protein YecT (DUF1311 family)
MDNMKRIVWIILGWMLIIAVVKPASFDCAKATTKVENLICSNDKLSDYDDNLSAIYQKVIKLSDNKRNIIITQQNWLSKVRNSCQDEACLIVVYRKRLHDLIITRKKLTLGKYGNANESEEDESSTGKVKLLYSENDSICNAILSVYQKLLDKNNHDVGYLSRSRSNPSNKGYWEDVYPDAFKNAGFVIPDKLIDYWHKSDERTSYYKLKLDPRLDDQIVLIQDYAVGGRGDYSSEVYISKPKEDISTVCSLDYFASFASDAYEN